MVGSKENPCRNITQVQFQGQGSGNFDKALQELGEVDQLAEIKANDHQWEGPEAVGQADPVGQRQPDAKVDIVYLQYINSAVASTKRTICQTVKRSFLLIWGAKYQPRKKIGTLAKVMLTLPKITGFKAKRPHEKRA